MLLAGRVTPRSGELLRRAQPARRRGPAREYGIEHLLRSPARGLRGEVEAVERAGVDAVDDARARRSAGAHGVGEVDDRHGVGMGTPVLRVELVQPDEA